MQATGLAGGHDYKRYLLFFGLGGFGKQRYDTVYYKQSADDDKEPIQKHPFTNNQKYTADYREYGNENRH